MGFLICRVLAESLPSPGAESESESILSFSSPRRVRVLEHWSKLRHSKDIQYYEICHNFKKSRCSHTILPLRKDFHVPWKCWDHAGPKFLAHAAGALLFAETNSHLSQCCITQTSQHKPSILPNNRLGLVMHFPLSLQWLSAPYSRRISVGEWSGQNLLVCPHKLSRNFFPSCS